jgi:hypothetical protein
MKVVEKPRLLALLFATGLLVFASNVDAGDGLFKCLHKKGQGQTVTTPTRAFLRRQCDAVKRGLANVPGLRNMIATHQARH